MALVARSVSGRGSDHAALNRGLPPPRRPWVDDGAMTQTELARIIVFVPGMLVAADLSFRAVVIGAYDRPPRGSRCLLRILAPVVVSFRGPVVSLWGILLAPWEQGEG